MSANSGCRDMIQVPAITYNEKMRWAGGGRKRVTKERG
jgi:hypothetical protein